MRSDSTTPMYIYALCEPGTRTIRYIGQAADPLKRLQAHWTGVGQLSAMSSPKDEWLAVLKRKRNRPRIFILDTSDPAGVDDLERRYIENYVAYGYALTNLAHNLDAHKRSVRVYRDNSKQRVKIPVQPKYIYSDEDFRNFTPRLRVWYVDPLGNASLNSASQQPAASKIATPKTYKDLWEQEKQAHAKTRASLADLTATAGVWESTYEFYRNMSRIDRERICEAQERELDARARAVKAEMFALQAEQRADIAEAHLRRVRQHPIGRFITR